MSDTREKLFYLMTDRGNPAWGNFRSNKEMLELVDYLIANGVTFQKWIPVSEPPKDPMERVLVKIKDANNIIGHPDMDTDRYMNGAWVRWGRYVTHWMPLPEMPKGD